MELLITAVIVITLILLVVKTMERQNDKSAIKPTYTYTRKSSIMTPSEIQCFHRLNAIVGERYYVFPQVHVSSLLDHAITGQDWRAALAKIQRKSVDFVLVDIQTLKTCYVIELDDATHDKTARRKRDTFINEIFQTAKLPLIRLRDIHSMTDEEIIQLLKIAHKNEPCTS